MEFLSRNPFTSARVYLLQDIDGHVKVMVLHGGGGVDGRQRAPDIDHELVVEAPVVQVVANSSHKHSQALKRTLYLDKTAGFEKPYL